MKRWLTTVATVFALIGGTGGAIAIAGDNHGAGRGAAYGQYCEGHAKEHGPGHAKHDDCGKGDENHGHEGGGGNGQGGHGD